MAWYCARMAKRMGVGPAGKKSTTPNDNGRRTRLRSRGVMIDVRRYVTAIKDCNLCQYISTIQ